ncbi:MAG: hypothetical protein Kow00123_18930 [Anaerolineales bacterium]
MGWGLARNGGAARLPPSRAGSTTVSTIVFHSPQSGHRPTHLGDVLPHCWHTYTVLVFGKAIRSPNVRPAH